MAACLRTPASLVVSASANPRLRGFPRARREPPLDPRRRSASEVERLQDQPGVGIDDRLACRPGLLLHTDEGRAPIVGPGKRAVLLRGPLHDLLHTEWRGPGGSPQFSSASI